jgi:hypothetical protein
MDVFLQEHRTEGRVLLMLFLFLILILNLSLKVIILPNFTIKHFPSYSLFIGMIWFSTPITLLMI